MWLHTPERQLPSLREGMLQLQWQKPLYVAIHESIGAEAPRQSSPKTAEDSPALTQRHTAGCKADTVTASTKTVGQVAEADKTATTKLTWETTHKHRDPLVTIDNTVPHHITKESITINANHIYFDSIRTTSP